MEQKEVTRVGGLKPIAIDVRFIAATNADLEEDIAKGTFREDLYYRLNGMSLLIPPLRERPAPEPGGAPEVPSWPCRAQPPRTQLTDRTLSPAQPWLGHCIQLA